MEYFIIIIALLVIYMVFNPRIFGIVPNQKIIIAGLIVLILANIGILIYCAYTNTSHFKVIIFVRRHYTRLECL